MRLSAILPSAHSTPQQRADNELYLGNNDDDMNLNRISELLRQLTARQEKVVRLYFGLGCRQAHSAQEIAAAFGVSPRTIAGTLQAATRKLAQQGSSNWRLTTMARAVGVQLSGPDVDSI